MSVLGQSRQAEGDDDEVLGHLGREEELPACMLDGPRVGHREKRGVTPLDRRVDLLDEDVLDAVARSHAREEGGDLRHVDVDPAIGEGLRDLLQHPVLRDRDPPSVRRDPLGRHQVDGLGPGNEGVDDPRRPGRSSGVEGREHPVDRDHARAAGQDQDDLLVEENRPLGIARRRGGRGSGARGRKRQPLLEPVAVLRRRAPRDGFRPSGEGGGSHEHVNRRQLQR